MEGTFTQAWRRSFYIYTIWQLKTSKLFKKKELQTFPTLQMRQQIKKQKPIWVAKIRRLISLSFPCFWCFECGRRLIARNSKELRRETVRRDFNFGLRLNCFVWELGFFSLIAIEFECDFWGWLNLNWIFGVGDKLGAVWLDFWVKFWWIFLRMKLLECWIWMEIAWVLFDWNFWVKIAWGWILIEFLKLLDILVEFLMDLCWWE